VYEGLLRGITARKLEAEEIFLHLRTILVGSAEPCAVTSIQSSENQPTPMRIL
jgi:hypothetical protein